MTAYESLSVFRNPCCLIDNCHDGTLKTCKDVLDQLRQISSPLNVIAITGPYRTGKSYLLNRLAGRSEGFEGFLLGSTIEATTKGIWVWCRPHPKRPKEVILLLDTEGLGDTEKGNEENDNWIFAISVLLSSTLVYNCMSTINQDGLSKLHYVTELTNRIKTNSTSNNKDGGDFYRYFPNFVWAVRDFTLRMKIKSKPITPDEYLANSLRLKEGKGNEIDDYNIPRKCIIEFFEDKRCFVFPIPAKETDRMEEVETLDESELNPKFISEVERFCDYIYTETCPKTASGQPIHGEMFCNLLENYISVIQQRAIPCVEDAVKNMAEKENAKAFEVSIEVYAAQMNKRLTSIKTRKGMLDAHLECNSIALDHFMSMSKLDAQQKYQTKLKTEIELKFKEICSKKCVDREVESTQDEGTAELNDAANHLNEVQKKLQEEKQNVITELDRKINQRLKEMERAIVENETLKKQAEQMKQERDKQQKDLLAIRDGGSSFGKFLKGIGSILVGTLKDALVSSGVVVESTINYAGKGAMLGRTFSTPGILVGSLVGGVVGFGKGIYDAILAICS